MGTFAVGLLLVVVIVSSFDSTVDEKAPELTLSQSPREWTPAPKTRPEKESAFDDVLSTTPDLDDPEDILTQNKARAGWWGHRHHPHRHNPHHHVKKFKKKMKRSTYSKGRKKKWNGRNFKKFKKKMKRSTYSKGKGRKGKGRKKRGRKKRGRKKRGRKKRGRKK